MYVSVARPDALPQQKLDSDLHASVVPGEAGRALTLEERLYALNDTRATTDCLALRRHTARNHGHQAQVVVCFHVSGKEVLKGRHARGLKRESDQ